MSPVLRRLVPVVLVVAVGLAACGDDDEDGGGEVDSAEVIVAYADGVLASYTASLASATTMDTAIDGFLADPSDETLEAAKDAWLAARNDYGLTESFRFYDGPIDNAETGKEGQINAWPMDEGVHRLRRRRSRRGHHQRPRHLSDDRRRAADVAQRGGRRGQHRHRMARHRVPAVGSGPQRRRPWRAPGRGLHVGGQRQTAARPT